jgi:hypothetical protein
VSKLPAHAIYLRDLAGKREVDAQLRIIRHKTSGWTDNAAGRAALEASLDDVERFGRLRRYAEELPHPPGPYSTGGFWRDMLAAHNGDPLASRRLGEQNVYAEEVTGAELRTHATPGFVPPGLEQRAGSSTTMAGLVPDGFAVDAAAGLAGRPSRPLLDALMASGAAFDLPPVGVDATIMVSTTQSLTASSTSGENVTVNQVDVVGVDSTRPVQAVVASIVVSRQAFDRGTIDGFINSELRRAVEAEQERLLVQQLLGSSLSFVAANTSEQVSVGKTVLQAARAASDVRGTPTRIIAWHPRRLLWMSSLRSSASQMDDVFHNLADEGHIVNVQSGALLASTIGSQDKVITMNGADVRYGEEPAIRAYIDPSSQAGPLGVRIFGYRYFSSHVAYPSQVGCASGAGLAAPAAFA